MPGRPEVNIASQIPGRPGHLSIGDIRNNKSPPALLLHSMNKRAAYIFVFILCSFSLFAQKGWELGAWIGTSHYFGDLKTEFKLNDPSLAGGINVRYNFNERISAMSSISYARLFADDAASTNTFERNRNLKFHTSLFSLNNQFEFNFLPYIHGSKEDFFTPYIFAGFSIFTYSPKTELNGTTYELRYFGTEGQPIGEEYGRFSIAASYGIGVKWDLNLDWSLNVHLSVHNSLTDYLDDVSSVYPDLDILGSVRGQTAVSLSDRAIVDGIGGTGRQRGNSKNNDMYILFGVSIMKYFGQLNCPKIVKNR